jgi:hypothetical protein
VHHSKNKYTPKTSPIIFRLLRSLFPQRKPLQQLPPQTATSCRNNGTGVSTEAVYSIRSRASLKPQSPGGVSQYLYLRCLVCDALSWRIFQRIPFRSAIAPAAAGVAGVAGSAPVRSRPAVGTPLRSPATAHRPAAEQPKGLPCGAVGTLQARKPGGMDLLALGQAAAATGASYCVSPASE